MSLFMNSVLSVCDVYGMQIRQGSKVQATIHVIMPISEESTVVLSIKGYNYTCTCPSLREATCTVSNQISIDMNNQTPYRYIFQTAINATCSSLVYM